MTSCEECRFVYDDLALEQIGPAVRAIGREYREALGGVDPALVGRRAEPEVWSASEYVCHVRDVLLVQRERVVAGLVIDRPPVVPMSRDERVAICRYDAQPLDAVLDQLTMGAELCALTFEGVEPSGWGRELLYHYPRTEVRDISWVGRHTVHEGRHHLADITGVLRALTADR